MARVPIFAVVGVPNAGKSTLINRLTGSAHHRRPRDARASPATARSSRRSGAVGDFKLIDTGGFDVGDRTDLGGDIRSQIKAALAEADAAVFVVDGRAGPLPGDYEIADVLRRAKIPTVLVANKVDDPRHEAELVAFYELGLGAAPVGVGAARARARATCSTTSWPSSTRPPARTSAGPDDDEPDEIPVAIVGRPNAGKSSLLNALSGEERVIVSDVAGTTRDAIDTTVAWRGRAFRFVDTAGMRKAAKVSGVEYYATCAASPASIARTSRSSWSTPLVGLGELDLQIAGEATQRGCATVLAVNKCDLQRARPRRDRRHRAAQAATAAAGARACRPCTGQGLEHILQLVTDLESRYTAHIPTAGLNRALAGIVEQRTHAGQGTQEAEDLLHLPVPDGAAAIRHRRQRPQPDHARVRLLRREPSA